MFVKRKRALVKSDGLIRYILSAVLLLSASIASAQTTLTIEGKSYSNSDASWMGVNIARTVPTLFTFRNNSISSVNTSGYMLQAGDEGIASTNNNLDGSVITGNKFIWYGTDMKSITHGLFTGQNLNALIKYNYLDHVPMGIIRKSANNMANTAGGIAYNIVKSGAVGINIKGMSNVNIYNNTLYSDRTTAETWRGLVYIYTHTDVTPNSVSHGTKIYNNIFYTKFQTYCIQIEDAESTIGLESDYNIFYCESGTPVFLYCGSKKTFAEWQALGYDTHSRVINPNFNDLTNFVPAARLDYGRDLGPEWAQGLSINAWWGTTDPETSSQNGQWQVGAVVYPAPQVNKPPSVSISSPTKSHAFISPATITIEATASDPDGTITRVEFYNGSIKLGEKTTAPWSFTWKEVSDGTYSLTASATDNSNSRTVSAAVSVVVEKTAPSINQQPVVTISAPLHNSSFEAPTTITLTASATDNDGSIARVEYFIGQEKIGESLTSPYTFSFQCDTAGVLEITAVASDNLNATTISVPISISLKMKRYNPAVMIVYPNPNNGHFTVDLPSLPEDEEEVTISIVTLSGRTVYSDILAGEALSRQIDISNSVSGNYIIMTSIGKQILSTKQFIRL